MQLTRRLRAFPLLLCCFTMPLAASAKNNNAYMQQMMLMNNVNAQEQKISGQISAYVGSGQLTPQQGAAFSSELSQISAMGITNGGDAANAMAELNNLSAQINGSLHVPSQYLPGAATNPWAGRNPGFYNNWRNNLANDERHWHDKNWHNAAVQQAQAQRIIQNEQAKEARKNNFINTEIRALQNTKAKQREAWQHGLNACKTPQQRAIFLQTHPAP